MCFFDQHRFACGDWKWGHFRQHCTKEYRIGETCGMKLVMQTVPTGTKCKLCEKIDTKMRRRAAEVDRIGRWQQEGSRFQASVKKAKEMIRNLDDEIAVLETERERDETQQTNQDENHGEIDRELKNTLPREVLASRDEAYESDNASQLGRESNSPRLFPFTATSDSGYRSGQGCDTESICSLDSFQSSIGMSMNMSQHFTIAFAKALMEKSGARIWAQYCVAHLTVVCIEEKLRTQLKQYAKALQVASLKSFSSTNPDDKQTGALLSCASRWVRHNSQRIARHFIEDISKLSKPSLELSVLHEEHGLHHEPQLSLAERVELLTRTETTYFSQDDKWAMEDDTETEASDDLQRAYDLIMGLDDFEALAKNINGELYKSPTAEINQVAILLDETSLCSESGAGFATSLTIHWPIIDVLQSKDHPLISSLASMIVLVGSAFYAQAMTMEEYVTLTWPKTGTIFVDLLERIGLCIGEKHQVDILEIMGLCTQEGTDHMERPITVKLERDGISVETHIYKSRIENRAFSDDRSKLVELAQEWAWIGCALRSSPYGDAPAYFKPLFLRKGSHSFEIMFKHSPLHQTEDVCWLSLFEGAAIATGFPITTRFGEVGLEIPLPLLAELAGVHRIVTYDGGTVMKGHDHLFVPVKRTKDHIQWHAISNPHSRKRMSIHDGLRNCSERLMTKDLLPEDAFKKRAVIGWCPVADINIGSDHLSYEKITYSATEDATAGIQINGGSIGFQEFGVASVELGRGSRNWKCHFQRKSTLQKIVRIASSTPVALYDTGERRAWLVPATDLILHMIQHRQRLGHFDTVQHLKHIGRDSQSAADVLLVCHDVTLSREDNITCKDETLSIWSQIDFLLDQNVARYQASTGTPIKNIFNETLYGFEYMAVTEERSPLKLKQAKVKNSHGGWPLLLQEIDALVLFARGFEDLITPNCSSRSKLCIKWQSAPRDHDYLITTSALLCQLTREAGDQAGKKCLSTNSMIQWHQGTARLYESCPDQQDCSCDRLQQLVPKSSIRSVVSPQTTILSGAVIFGRCKKKDGTVACKIVKSAKTPRSDRRAHHGIFRHPNTPLLIDALPTSANSTNSVSPRLGLEISQASNVEVEPSGQIHMQLSDALSVISSSNQGRAVVFNASDASLRANIDRSMEIIRNLDNEIYELSCERKRRLQSIGH